LWRGWATPKMGSVKPTHLHKPKIFDDDTLIRKRSVSRGFKIFYGIKIGNVNPPSIWGRTTVVVLVGIHGKDKYVNTINGLEQPDTLCVNWKSHWTTMLLVSRVHLRQHRSL
jgi:hypothetical protein